MRRNWVAVASANHVRRGRSEGFMQLCHGKEGPLHRIYPGDYVIYYSPTEEFKGVTKSQAFTAIGVVTEAAPYQVVMDTHFCPYRRDVKWLEGEETPIHPLLPILEFTQGRKNWGYRLRPGLLQISDHDLHIIATAMGILKEPLSKV